MRRFVLISAAMLTCLSAGSGCLDGLFVDDCEVRIDDNCLDDLFTDDDDRGFFGGIRDIIDDAD